MIEYYNFDDNNLYKYYNPNLIRNHGNVKTDQSLRLDFPKSVVICTTTSTSISDNNLLAKKKKLIKKKIIFLTIKESGRQETRINNKSVKDHPTNK